MSRAAITMTRHLTSRKTSVPAAEMAVIVEQLAVIGKRIAHRLAGVSLVGDHGYTGVTNVQGEQQKKLDLWCDDVFTQAFAARSPVCTLVSEEMEQAVHYAANCAAHAFAVLYDPLDGSSNTDVNGAMGTIFALRRRAERHGHELTDLLQPGTLQTAAGYLVYGPSTQMALTFGDGVHIYTLDREIGEFMLWREDVRMPARGASYAVNQGRHENWHPAARSFIAALTTKSARGVVHSTRYCGAFVADFHRCLLEGGIYCYPGEVNPGGHPDGKLRLIYEVAPLAMIAEQAGGKASTGKGPVLEVTPRAIHQRVPVYIGSAEEVELAERLKVEG